MNNTFHFFLPGDSTTGTAIALLLDFLSYSWFCQTIFQAESVMVCGRFEALRVEVMLTAADIVPSLMNTLQKDGWMFLLVKISYRNSLLIVLILT